MTTIPQITKDADAVVSVFLAGQSARYVKQYCEQGPKVPLISTGVMTDEHVLRGL